MHVELKLNVDIMPHRIQTAALVGIVLSEVVALLLLSAHEVKIMRLRKLIIVILMCPDIVCTLRMLN